MNNINEYIQEKLVINKNVKGNIYNPDDFNNDNITLYSDFEEVEEENDKDILWEDCQFQLEKLSDNYDGFVVFQFRSLGKSKNLDKDLENIYESLIDAKDNIIDGKDAGYEVKLVSGHIEFHCINSGSRGIYYIYAVTKETYEKVESYLWGEDDVEDLDFLLKKGNIVEIEKI